MQPVTIRHDSWQAAFSAVRDMGRGARVLLVILFLGISVPLYSQVLSSEKAAGCPGDTVDRMGAAIAKRSRAFLRKLRSAVREGNKRQVASMLRYPIDVSIADKIFRVNNPEEFMHNYERIVDGSVKAAILDEKPSRCLFSNSEGFMVGDGEVWFDEVSPGVFKVITFNLGNSPDEDVAK
jgi:hypothetical protein